MKDYYARTWGSLPGRFIALHFTPQLWRMRPIAWRHQVDDVRSLIVGAGPFLFTHLRSLS